MSDDDNDKLVWQLSIAIIFIAAISDIVFLWIMHYVSTRYPRPTDKATWNETYTLYGHDCCQGNCNQDLSRCFCGLRCRKVLCPIQCNCCYPMELFIPRYPPSFFNLMEIAPHDLDDDIDDIRDLELKPLTNKEETKEDHAEEEKDAEFETINGEVFTLTRRQSSLASIEHHSNLQILHDRYGKCCCCSCISIAMKLWFLACGILSFAVFIIFAFTIFFEFWVKCTTWENAQFLGYIVAIFIVCKILIWFLYHSFQACWLLTYNVCDANHILIVEWWRLWQIFWCVMFAVIYLSAMDPDALNNALISQTTARFMVIQGMVWIVIYWITVIISSVWLILNLFDCKTCTSASCDLFNPYKWNWVKRNSLCKRYCEDYAQKMMIFENQKQNQYVLTVLDFLTGLRAYSVGNKYDIKACNYFQYLFVAVLLMAGVIFIILGTVMGDGWELMYFSGWSFLIYYVLIVLIKRDDFDSICFKMWNGVSYKKIYFLLKQVTDKHPENYYYSYLSSEIKGCDVIILRYVDIWSMYHHYTDSPNCVCIKKNDKEPRDQDGEEIDIKSSKYSMWQLKQFNVQLWMTILILLVPFSIIIWASSEAQQAQRSTVLYDKEGVSKWDWSADALGQDQYPFCRATQINGYLNAFDLMWLSQSGWYFEDTYMLEMGFTAWFGDSDTGWDYNRTLVNFVTASDTHIYEPTAYYIENTKHNIDLIVIRGSYTYADWMQDANLWAEAVLIQMISLVVPITNICGDGFIRDLVYLSSRAQGMIFPELRSRYDEDVYQFIFTLVIAGHSLGAGVSQIVASRLHHDGLGTNVIGFALSPPGTLWSSKKFGYDIKDLDVSVLTVIPRRDPVPMVDAQGGMIQYIDCDAYHLWPCHSAIRSLCEIYHSCGAGQQTYGNNLRNVEFVECLCIDANDWNHCVNNTLA
eukprot:389825_1